MARVPRPLASRMLLASLLLATLPLEAGAAAPFFSGIGHLAGGMPPASGASGVSNGGRVIGASAQGLFPAPVLWTPAGGLEPYGTGGGSLHGISADGRVLLVADAAGYRLDIEGEPTVLVGLSGIRGLSADGTTVTGYRDRADLGSFEAARWSEAGGVEPLGFLPHQNLQSLAIDASADGSVVTGTTRNNELAPGFHWTAATGMQPMDSIDPVTFGKAQFIAAISGSGEKILGFKGGEGYVWSEAGGYTSLGNTFTPGIPKLPRDLDFFGDLVVGGNFAGDTSAAFLWDPVNGMRELHAVLESDYGLDLTGWVLLEATAISLNGRWIVGAGINPDGEREGWVAFLGSPGCGLGAELALLLGFLAPWWRRRALG